MIEEMKLEEGMYVRIEKGIYKINYFINNNYTQKFTYIDNKGVSNILENDEIIKVSHNIIDLIEVGDYVNGYPVYETIEHPDNTRAIVIGDDYKSVIWEESPQYIKSIVTKEQFESISYKMGE